MKWILIGFAMMIHATKPKPTVVIQTSFGDITVELEDEKAVESTKNFLRYVDEGHYKGSRFHRTVTMDNQADKKIKIEVIQGGVGKDWEKKDFPKIKLERTKDTGLKHLDGTISMARDGADTATSDFFICIGDQPELDFGGKRNPDGQGFAAFGKVTKGMDIVRKIQSQPNENQTLTPAIIIKDIKRTKSK
jgi:peptidyl-prolyl cis-trans isomerase A (cyclophilin A)